MNKENNFTLTNQNNSISFLINNKDKLINLIPFFGNEFANISVKNVTVKDSISSVCYSNSENKNEINLLIKGLDNNHFLYSISSNSEISLSADDALGFTIGTIPGFMQGLTFYKYGSVKAWTHPIKINYPDSIPEVDNQFFLWQYNDSTYACIVPLAANGFVSQIGLVNGKLAIKAHSYISMNQKIDATLCIISFGNDPYKLISSAYEKGLTAMSKSENLRKNKTYPALFDKILWCTWNSFGHTLNANQVFEGLERFKKSGFKLPNLLLDDGWSVVSAYGTGMLQSYKPESNKFPEGFGPFIKKAKTEFGVENIGVWHAFNGYWAGIDPNSELGKQYKNDLIPYLDKVAWTNNPIDTFYFVNPFSKSGSAFYENWHQMLKNDGVSFVKVDNQLIINRISKNNFAFEKTAIAMESNMQKSVKKYFNGNIINCMDMTNDAVYNFGQSAVGRSSEDYFPENTSFNITAGNEAIHILCNAYNSLWWSQMVWSDWDMFQTHKPNANYHAVARAISGGPIYITDNPGNTNYDLLKQLILNDGSILRADQPALPTKDCLFSLGTNTPLKVFTLSNGAGMLAAFGITEDSISEGNFKASDIQGLDGRKFIVYDYFKGTFAKVQKDESIPITLNKLGVKLYIVKPIVEKFASIGLKNKFNAPKTIKKEMLANKMALIELQQSGTFIAWCEREPLKVVGSNEIPLVFTLKENILEIIVPEGENKIAIQF
ncbi:MAG: Sip1-related alpha-galactosidase [Bacteroidota bacterium]|nr:Sip1-related alpha-galactosidase [Bacteroidota bacterium]